MNLDGTKFEKFSYHVIVSQVETDAWPEAGFQEVKLNFYRPRVNWKLVLQDWKPMGLIYT